VQPPGASVDIVLPCLDEARALPWVLERLPEGARALVVDNGSTDGSRDIARDLGATVVTCTARGYGAACHAGLEAATAPVVAVCDCDGSLDPGDVLRLLAVLDQGADLVIGRRRATERSAWSLSSRVANRELARRIRRRTGLRIVDVGPLRVARREALLSLGLTDRRSGYPAETVVRAADAGWRIAQVDVPYGPRIGTSKITGTLRGTVQAVRDMSAAISAPSARPGSTQQ
jgi:glycosyltransferase involved in cell wall biosynthesis